MNCSRCNHTHQAHKLQEKNRHDSLDTPLMLVGRCLIPGCYCHKYVDKIEKIDEDLL